MGSCQSKLCKVLRLILNDKQNIVRKYLEFTNFNITFQHYLVKFDSTKYLTAGNVDLG